MIFDDRPDRRRHWITASVLSVAAHVGGLAYAFDLIDLPSAQQPNTMVFPTIEVTALTVALPDVTVVPGNDPAPTETLQPAPAEGSTLTGQALANATPQTPDAPTPLARAADPVRLKAETAQTTAARSAPVALRPDMSEQTPSATGQTLAQTGSSVVLRPQASVGTVLSSTLPATPNAAPTPAPVTPEDAAPPDPVLTELVARIRGRLADPCLVALPRGTDADGAARLDVLAADDRQIARFNTEVLGDTDLDVALQQYLFDARQCPALDLARAQPTYPTLRLAMNIAAPVVPSGGTLTGVIDGVAGQYVSLLLVDANGVVQDLRRFMRFQNGRAEFEVPVTLDGAARDTSQLLLALTTAQRPETITQLAGNLAQTVFAPLRLEIGTGARVALVPFDVR